MSDLDDDMSVTVSCPSHGEVLVSGLWNFFLADHRTDSEFQRVPGGRSIRAHQLIVEVFLPPERLMHQSWLEHLASATAVDSDPAGDQVNYLDFLLEFMYRGRVRVAKERLVRLHQLAEQLGFQLLVDAIDSCDETMMSRETEPHDYLDVTVDEEPEHSSSDVEAPAGRVNTRSRTCSSRNNGGVVASDSEAEVELSATIRRRSDMISSRTRHSTRKIAHKSSAYNADPKLYHCSHCPYESPKYGNFLNHLRSTHQVNVRGKPIQKRYKCSECNYAHVFQSALKRHVKIKHSDKLFKCDQCDFASNSRARLNAHTNRTHLTTHPDQTEETTTTRATPGGTGKIRHCPYCSFETSKVGNYHSHLRSIHKVTSRGEPVIKKYKCAECGFGPVFRHELKQHQQQSHSTTARGSARSSNNNNNNGNFQCPLCAFATSNWAKLNAHVNKTHIGTAATIDAFGDDDGDFNSNKGSQRSPRQRMAESESSERGGVDAVAESGAPKVHRCAHCEYETLKVGNYHNHLRSIHRITARGEPAVKKYKCNECEYAHVFQSAVKRHQKVKHSKEKPFRCQQCPFASNSRGQLNAHHNRVHLGLKKVPPGPRGKHHICDVCGRFFTGRDSLKAHCKKFHDAAAATYTCELCDYTSNSKREVAVVHRNLAHSGDKPHPFTCATCGHRSPTRYDMERHRLTHTGERPYKCDVCQRGFSQRGHLNVHKKRQHPDDDQPQFACDVTLSTE